MTNRNQLRHRHRKALIFIRRQFSTHKKKKSGAVKSKRLTSNEKKSNFENVNHINVTRVEMGGRIYCPRESGLK